MPLIACPRCGRQVNGTARLQRHLGRKVPCTPHITALDLFCGAGGMTAGLQSAGISVIAGIDNKQIAINTYNSNFNNTGICADLTTLTPEEFAKTHPASIDLIVGGPPCQGFSIAGKRNQADPRNLLFWQFVAYINYFHPRAIIMENVIGILSMRTPINTPVIDTIIASLSNYNCAINKLCASDFEVPQNRRRMLLVGLRKDLQLRPPPIARIITSIASRLPVAPCLLPRNEIPATQYLSARAIAGIANKKAKSQARGVGFGAQFLSPSKPSYTMTARGWKDGYDALVKYDDLHIRRLTILERARIQTFPDEFQWCGTKRQVIEQIGNAVPVRLAYFVGRALCDMLNSN